MSWWISSDTEEKKTPFDYWVTGQRGCTTALEGADELSVCASIDAESEEAAWQVISPYFPGYIQRFIEEKPIDWQPGDRFQK